jgi:hypothetical protein
MLEYILKKKKKKKAHVWYLIPTRFFPLDILAPLPPFPCSKFSAPLPPFFLFF